jgi:phage terminase large subunit GpA-like protein
MAVVGVANARDRSMQIPLDLTFRDMPPSESVTTAIHHWLDRLGHVEERIQHCTVVVERPHHSQRHGQPFHVRVEVAVPDHVVTIARDPGVDSAHENVYAAVADAFRAARRQLVDHASIRRGDVKAHH